MVDTKQFEHAAFSRRARCANDFRAFEFGDLDGRHTNAARCAMNEYGFAGFEPRQIVERVVSSEENGGDGGPRRDLNRRE